MEGTVARVKVDRGFGFISVVGGADYFFHMKDVQLRDELEFDRAASPAGERAVRHHHMRPRATCGEC